jgi:hypothetical protein
LSILINNGIGNGNIVMGVFIGSQTSYGNNKANPLTPVFRSTGGPSIGILQAVVHQIFMLFFVVYGHF